MNFLCQPTNTRMFSTTTCELRKAHIVGTSTGTIDPLVSFECCVSCPGPVSLRTGRVRHVEPTRRGSGNWNSQRQRWNNAQAGRNKYVARRKAGLE